jgi:hypothetical protein
MFFSICKLISLTLVVKLILFIKTLLLICKLVWYYIIYAGAEFELRSFHLSILNVKFLAIRLFTKKIKLSEANERDDTISLSLLALINGYVFEYSYKNGIIFKKN